MARAYSYNSLQQPTSMTDTLSGAMLFSLNYTFGASGPNNGNPSQVVAGGLGSGLGFTQNYFYDKLNRLCAAGECGTQRSQFSTASMGRSASYLKACWARQTGGGADGPSHNNLQKSYPPQMQ